MSDFEPKIVAFCCNFCAFAAADLAGAMRLQYSPNVRIIRLPCTGKVDAILLMEALAEGADGVFIAGCHPGDCHYVEGNYYARRRFALMGSLLEYLGIEKERYQVEWVSASEGKKFTQLVSSFTDKVAGLGPRVKG